MSIRPRVIISVSLHEVDTAPDTKTGAKGNNEGLQNGDCLIEKFHK